jgi:D-alanyl-D-alanine carboxypeptidase
MRLFETADFQVDYRARVEALLKELGVPAEIVAGRALPLQPEPESLELVEIGVNAREHYLVPAAAAAYRELRAAASSDGVVLTVVSAFRSLERQADIVRGKLASGLSFEAVFCASAPPGYSEHHTGRALDVTTPGARALEVEFEQTQAFEWLTRNAGRFGFTLSYPRGNSYGFIYEPWHWCFSRARD